jgi:hypothetical protein
MPPFLFLVLPGCSGTDGPIQSVDSTSSIGDDDDDDLSGVETDLVTGVTELAPPGGFVSGVLLDREDLVEVLLDGIPLEIAWEPGGLAAHRLWRLPDGVAPGPTELVFQTGDRRYERVPFVVGERWFEEVAGQMGLVEPHVTEGWPQECAESLAGFGFADLDVDGDLDLVRGHLTAGAQILVNEGDLNGDGLPDFVDKTVPFGFLGHDSVASVHFADYDNDGDPDLFLGRRGPNRLLENRRIPDGLVRFVDRTADAGLVQADQRTTGAAWGDYDNDGNLDLYEVNHTWCFPGTELEPNQSDHFYRNLGDGTFKEITSDLPDLNGQISARFGFAAIFVDVDRDHDQDLWIVNDWVDGGGRSVFLRNRGEQGDWTFFDDSDTSGITPLKDSFGKGVNAMGGAIGDVNGDGLPDFAFSNIGPNFLVTSQPGGTWTDEAFKLGVSRSNLPWGAESVTWGTHLFDLDLDRDLDLFFVGGQLKGAEYQPHALFVNQRAGMTDVTWEAGVAAPVHGSASAQLDLDGDGYLDLVVAGFGDPLQVWHNRLASRQDLHWLTVDPVGNGTTVNRDAFGAIIELTHLDGSVSTCFRNPMPSMSATGDPGCHFGLGTDTAIDHLTVTWPDGHSQDLLVQNIDQRVKVSYAP